MDAFRTWSESVRSLTACPDSRHRGPGTGPLLPLTASASTDPVTPSRSGLHLLDGILPTSAIGQLSLAHAELAYLSACSTAHREWRQADEALHLASAFHLAGFRHVIASLWSLDDRTAATAAHAFYQRLPATTADHAATALHHVTRSLRAEHPDRPDLWAPLIHSGP